MTIDSTVVMGAVISIVVTTAVTMLGWFLSRLFGQIDAKLDQLGQKDGLISIELAELRVRISHVEYLVLGVRPIQTLPREAAK